MLYEEVAQQPQFSAIPLPGALLQFWRSIDDGQTFLPISVVGANDLAALGYTADQAVQGAVEAKLFTEEEIPWDEIAFRTVRETLEHYFEDRRRGSFDRVHTIDIV